jgi:histidine triad (HIT) family protein
LHVEGVGVTQCRRLAGAEYVVRDYVATVTKSDPRSFDVLIMPETGLRASLRGVQMSSDRRPMDLQGYVQRTRTGPCFVCAFLSGHPDYPHETVYEDSAHIAFLDRWPTLPGKVLVAPKAHLEHVVRDLDERAFSRLMGVVRGVALAVEDVFPSERTYLYSLGSQQANAHLHWHIAALPPGTPVDEQQFYALMTENGVLSPGPDEMAVTAALLRDAAVRRLSAGRASDARPARPGEQVGE